MNLNKFTEKAQEAVITAQNIATELTHAEVTPEHLLVALVEQTGGIVPSVLRKMMLDPARVAADARKFGLDLRNVDVSCVSLETRQSGGYIEIEAQLRLAISDDRGKMLSFLSGGAKVQIPRKTYDARYLPQLRKEALENAVRGSFVNLVDHLRRAEGS